MHRADLPELCRRPGDDSVRDVFCADEAPQVTSLHDLQAQLGLLLDEASFGPTDQPATLPAYIDAPANQLVLLNTSTALAGRFVSTINPRAIVVGLPGMLAFNRGVQQVELIARDRERPILNFYLLRFEQACNVAPQGCAPGDLYTPRIESDWTSIQIDDDEALKNTASDCRQCHQRALDEPIFLMRELDGPWTHFFMPDADTPLGAPEATGVDVVRTYYRAKGDEPYASIPWAAIRSTIGLTLQNAVDRPQPVLFDGDKVLHERWPYEVDRGFPESPSPSAWWYQEYEAFKRGEHLAVPYFDVYPTDPDKLARMTEVYRAYRAGEITEGELPDLSDVYPDDPQVRAEIGLQTEPHASPAETLVQACGACHNDRLDQTISRAHFNIDLSRLGRDELERAIERISLPLDDPGHMPPRDFRQLDPSALAPLIEYLKGDSRSADDDALLQSASDLGMALDMKLTPLSR